MNSQELAYVIITPYSLSKSRTGGIIARLTSRTGLPLVGARMFGPSRELVEEYAKAVVSTADPQARPIQELIRDYVRSDLGPDLKTGQRRRVMMLLFQGEDAVRKVRSVVGHITTDRRTGETIRDSFGDLVMDVQGQVRYFEPAVLAAPCASEATQKLHIWSRYSDSDGGLLQGVVTYQPSERPERTLVLIKPDNFRFPTGRPGNVIDFFSRTGLYIVGIKVHRMSVAQAMEFYGPVLEMLKTRLQDFVADRAAPLLEKEFGFSLTPELRSRLGQVLCPAYGEHHFGNIIRFMAGHAPDEQESTRHHEPGTETCLALVYEGVDAVRRIREVLGPTDPSKAPPGSIRREFGQSVMINAAHASDSVESARREIDLIDMTDRAFGELAGS